MNPDQTAPKGSYCLHYRLSKNIRETTVMNCKIRVDQAANEFLFSAYQCL